MQLEIEHLAEDEIADEHLDDECRKAHAQNAGRKYDPADGQADQRLKGVDGVHRTVDLDPLGIQGVGTSHRDETCGQDKREEHRNAQVEILEAAVLLAPATCRESIRMKLRFFVDKPPSLPIAYQEVLMDAETSAEYFS